MEAVPEALLLEQRASFMEDLSSCGPTFRNHFVLCGNFLRLQVQWSHDNECEACVDSAVLICPQRPSAALP